MAHNLSAFSLNPEDAKEEWLRDQLKSGRLAGMLNNSRIFSYLTAAAPGLDELVTLGKIWELAQMERRNKSDSAFDTCVVDAPASGHGVAMLRSRARTPTSPRSARSRGTRPSSTRTSATGARPR